jgi:phosphate transport system protein
MGQHRHIDAYFDAELRQLKAHVVSMGSLVERQVSAALSAFARRDLQRALTVQRGDREINELERDIDERCVGLIALRQPAASDLRLIAAILKSVTDLERIGDLAVDTASRAEALDDAPPPSLEQLLNLGDVALTTLRESLQAFTKDDLQLARRVVATDTTTNQAVATLIERLRQAMAREPRLVDSGTATLMATMHVQRMAAHARNIAEMVIYSQSGEDVRHSS